MQRGLARVFRPQIVPVSSVFRSARVQPRGQPNCTAVHPLRLGQPSVRMASTAAPIRFAEGEDTEQVTAGLNSLRQRGWQLDNEGIGITKTFYFKTYFKAVTFVNVIAAESAAQKHHAIMTVRIGSVDVYWTTHKPRGLTRRDVNMAEHCEKGAETMGAVVQNEGQKC